MLSQWVAPDAVRLTVVDPNGTPFSGIVYLRETDAKTLRSVLSDTVFFGTRSPSGLLPANSGDPIAETLYMRELNDPDRRVVLKGLQVFAGPVVDAERLLFLHQLRR